MSSQSANQPTPSQPAGGEPTPGELREQIEHTRDELGRTVEALAAKADIKAQAADKVALVTGQVRGRIEHAAHLASEKTPDPVLEQASRAAGAARANRTALLAVGAALIVFLVVRRKRGQR
ncbi:DUF3618 domain-containing protein [Streptomyces sp. NPDC048257]|uniref:DUF3618 domain-containing protein n=1 Tax=Streptomyces sp. NPDC048257 TaxID=3365526 RepID=UPI0037123CD2